MALFNIIMLLGLSWYAAQFNVGYKWEAHLRGNSLPQNDNRTWWVRTWDRFLKYLSFEAFWRTLYINITFAGASMAAVITGYKGDNAFDFWMNPWVPFFACCIVGASSQKWLADDITDSISVSWPAIWRNVGTGILTLAVYVYAAILSYGYVTWWKPVP